MQIASKKHYSTIIACFQRPCCSKQLVLTTEAGYSSTQKLESKQYKYSIVVLRKTRMMAAACSHQPAVSKLTVPLCTVQLQCYKERGQANEYLSRSSTNQSVAAHCFFCRGRRIIAIFIIVHRCSTFFAPQFNRKLFWRHFLTSIIILLMGMPLLFRASELDTGFAMSHLVFYSQCGGRRIGSKILSFCESQSLCVCVTRTSFLSVPAEIFLFRVRYDFVTLQSIQIEKLSIPLHQHKPGACQLSL